MFPRKHGIASCNVLNAAKRKVNIDSNIQSPDWIELEVYWRR